MPSLWEFTIDGAGPMDRRALHRTLSRWLDDDHHAAHKPWSWSASVGPEPTVVRVGVLVDPLAKRLIDGVDAARRATRSSLVRPTGPARPVGAASWAELCSGAVRREWMVDFVSPVTFRRGNRFLPWPAPSAVLGSLRSAWHTFGAAEAGALAVDLKLDPVVVAAISGASTTERVVLHERPQPDGARAEVAVTVGGFTGQVSYAVDGDIDPAAVSTLVRLAPFAGIGAYTTRGFGGVRVS